MYQVKNALRKFIQAFGYDLYRYPASCERLIPHLSMLLRSHHVDAVIDVGANIGQFACQIRALNRDIFIHSIEPAPDVHKRLVAKAKYDDRWSTSQCALGRSRGKVILNIFTSSDFNSCLCASESGARRFENDLRVLDKVEVDLRTLDDLLVSTSPQLLSSRLLLKLDTQGFDMEVLLGASSALESAQVVVTEAPHLPIYEGATLFPDILNFMQSKGFELSGFFPVSRHNDLSIIESDCVFIRPIK